MSSLLTFFRQFLMYGKKTSSANSPIVTAVPGRISCSRSAPSKIATAVDCVDCGGSTRSVYEISEISEARNNVCFFPMAHYTMSRKRWWMDDKNVQVRI